MQSKRCATIEHVGVVGSGTMAPGIAEVFAKAGFAVTLVARSADAQARAARRHQQEPGEGGPARQARGADRAATLDRLAVSTRLDDLADADLVVEAVVEELDVKQALFENLDEICRPGAILATTTSSLPVVECAVGDHAAGRRGGAALLQPGAGDAAGRGGPHRLHLAPTSSPACKAVVERLGKHPVECGDRSGFIVNALLFPYLNDAVKMLQAHYAGVDDIDTAMKTGCGYPMGPFELLDVVGLDVSLAIQRQLYLEFREPGFAPAPLLEQLVTAGYLGRKSGRGFRDYT